MDDMIIISCIFGTKFKYVYNAPLLSNCYFFTNNPDLKKELINKNWNFVYVPFELSDNYIKSSLQSKYIKFLEFLNDFPKFKKYTRILYFDHKLYIKQEHVKQIIEKSNNKILIRQHENKNTILEEMIESEKQPRYRYNRDIINEMIVKSGLNTNKIIHNTGLIYYNNYGEILHMLHDIYTFCIIYNNPECQIIWEIFSQKYNKYIKTIDFTDIDILWIEPQYTKVNNNFNNYVYFLILILILIIIKIK